MVRDRVAKKKKKKKRLFRVETERIFKEIRITRSNPPKLVPGVHTQGLILSKNFIFFSSSEPRLFFFFFCAKSVL